MGRLGITGLVLLALSWGIEARVTGPCATCHTMHNSQHGQPVVRLGGWNPDAGRLTGSPVREPQKHLLVTSCAGCHTNAVDGRTIVTIGSGAGRVRIPIVFNAAVEPQYPQDYPVSGQEVALAGGNFWWVLHGSAYCGDGDQLGHNVLEIPGMGEDGHLDHAPGGPSWWGSCALCHNRLTRCRSCHNGPQHHREDHPGGSYDNVVGAGATAGAYYRFLGVAEVDSWSHSGTARDPYGEFPWIHKFAGVKGVEDADWEQTASCSDHNEYAGETEKTPHLSLGYQSMSDFCCGCHKDFHALSNPSGVGTGSPWLRHPTDFKLGDATGTEYLYNTPDGTSFGPYVPLVPVARPDIDAYDGSGPSSAVTGEDQVQCLSCHRAHGSPYPDMLRWPYSGMIAGGGPGCAEGKGCFVCHTRKDD